MKSRRKRKIDAKPSCEVEGPAIVRVAHRQDRALSDDFGAAKGWRIVAPLDAAFERGQLGGGNPRFNAEQRLEAGRYYERLSAATQTSGRDSTNIEHIGSTAPAMGLTETQARAMRLLAEIDRRLNSRDRLIVRMVCAEGHFPSDAVRTACNDYRHTVPSRFREALDSLIEAVAAARRDARTNQSPGDKER